MKRRAPAPMVSIVWSIGTAPKMVTRVFIRPAGTLRAAERFFRSCCGWENYWHSTSQPPRSNATLTRALSRVAFTVQLKRALLTCWPAIVEVRSKKRACSLRRLSTALHDLCARRDRCRYCMSKEATTPGLPFVYSGYSGGAQTAYIIVMAGQPTGHVMP